MATDPGGTYGGLNVPGTSLGNSSKNPLNLTGMTQQQLATGVATGSRSTTPSPGDPVYVGRGALGLKGPGSPGRRSDAERGYTTYDQAQNLPASWYANDPNRYKQLLSQMIMYKVPGINSDSGLPEVGQAWDSLVQMSINLNKAQGDNVTKSWTPYDILNSYNKPAGSLGTRKVGDFLVDVATGEKVKYVGPKSKTTKQTAIDLSDPEAVQAIATQTLTQMIGRAPTDKELAQFKATLNGYERSHPENTTTTETYDDMGNVSASNVVHSGGVTDAARATVLGEGLKKTPEYAKYQGGTTYFNALMQMIGGG